jgi:hypothetical protein
MNKENKTHTDNQVPVSNKKQMIERILTKLSCEICFNNFNCTNYTPIVYSCGHSICLYCSAVISNKKCPFCKVEIANKVTNFMMIDVLNAINMEHKISKYGSFEPFFGKNKLKSDKNDEIDYKLCPNKHLLKCDILPKCDYCKNCNIKGVYCENCFYGICFQCVDVNFPSEIKLSFNFSKNGRKNSKACDLGHKINNTVIYFKKEKNSDNKSLRYKNSCYQCDCKLEFYFTCCLCENYQICLNCYGLNFPTKTCLQGHEISWTSESYKCVRCLFNDKGFRCFTCSENKNNALTESNTISTYPYYLCVSCVNYYKTSSFVEIKK